MVVDWRASPSAGKLEDVLGKVIFAFFVFTRAWFGLGRLWNESG